MNSATQASTGRLSRRRWILLVVATVSLVLMVGILVWWVQGWRDTGTAPFTHDFDGPAGSKPDPAMWTVQTGGGGWGNNELQEYTHGAVALDGSGNLAITATVPRDGSTPTSGRITTQGNWSFSYGTLSARIQLPDGKGFLPAFWLLGDSIVTAGWPSSGEIDIVETPNTTLRSAHHLHGPVTSTDSWSTNSSIDFSTPLSNDFHVYAVERSPGLVVLRVDDEVVLEASPDDMPADGSWVFDERFHMLFSLAVGGNWPGDPDATTPESAQMLIDWISFEPMTSPD